MHSVSGSDSGHDSVGYSQGGGRESLASARKSVGDSMSISARLSNFKVSMAYESALHKKKCGLCQMFFERDTVKYKVPNHRVFDLQNSWAEKRGLPVNRNGRRYKSASFLYTETAICAFCSQFFWLLNDELEERLQSKPKTVSLDSKGPKLDVVTDFERADVSQYQRAYQSSDVDGKLALYAITPPFDMISKTRREADPWWEVDLGRNYLLSKISFKITVHVRQAFSIYIFLLDKPVGFEDPFLDSISGRARETKLFNIEAEDQKRQLTLVWNLSSSAKCFAIRIQLKGIHILELQEFQAFLGDEVILETEDDAKVIASSFATLNPKVIHEGLKEMMSPQKKAEKLQKLPSPPKDKEKIHRISEEAVKLLSDKINSRYSTLGDWKGRVMEFSKSFTLDEVEALYKVIFKYTAEINKNNQESSFNEHDLLGSSLMEHYPRCELQELHQRIRTVLRWIQTRSHLKILGALLHSEILNQISINSHEYLYKFMSAIKRIELYWDKKEEYESMYAHLEDQKAGVLPMRVRESRGCSWSQFLILFSLFIQQRSDDIAYHVFRINNPNVTAIPSCGDDVLSVQSYQTGDAMSVKSFDVSLPDHAKKHHRSMITSQSLVRLSTPARPLTGQSFLKGNTSKDDSIVLNVRKDTGKVPFDSRMSEFKMDYILRRMVRVDIEFPKQLDLNFAKGLIPTRDGSLGGNATDDDDALVENVDAVPTFAFGLQDDHQSHHSNSNTSTILDYNGAPLPSRPAPLQRGITAKFQMLRSTSKLSKLISDGTVDVPTHPTPISAKKHAMFNIGKSSRSLLSSSAPSSSMLLAMHNQRSTRSISSEDDYSSPAPPLSRSFPRSGTLKDLHASPMSHNLTTVREGAHGEAHHTGLLRSPSKSNLLHSLSSSRNLQKAPSSASVLSSSGGNDHRNVSPSRPSTLFQLSNTGGTGVKALNPNSHNHDSSPVKTERRGSSSPTKANASALPSGTKDDDSENVDDIDFDDDGNNRRRPSTAEVHKSVDFHRICSLCELRLPRASVDFKVMRKHVVKLKSSWDPKLVSKEVRQLDNTISMYNLVYVCAFCAQFFDPDFPDGIAYPQRIPFQSKVPADADEESKVLLSLGDNMKDVSLLPYYDMRYTANSVEVGEVFRRPQTMDSRKRALRAVEVAKTFSNNGQSQSTSSDASTGRRSPSPSQREN